MARPQPTPTPDTAPYWEAASRRELQLPQCRACSQFHFYPRSICPHCGAMDLVWQPVAGTGRLVSYVVNHRPWPATDDGEPVVVAMVELTEGPRMMTNIVGVAPEPARIPLDADVVVDFEVSGDTTVPVFRLKELS